jgi:MFS family permease
VNRGLFRMGHAPVEALPLIPVQVRKRFVAEIFDPRWLRMTVLLTLAYFLHVTTFYFIMKWVPKIVVDELGVTPAAAAGVLVWANVGGATGGAVLGLLSLRLGLKPLTVFVLAMSTVMVVVFGQGQTSLAQVSLVCAGIGFFTNGAIVGIYGILAKAYPTQLRATGTGFAVGLGRAGAILGPSVAGFLFRAGYSLEFVAVAMGSGSLVAAIALWLLPLSTAKVEIA